MNQWAAGWYPDPEQQGQIRYWDGASWTEHRQPMPSDFGFPDQGGSDAGHQEASASSEQHDSDGTSDWSAGAGSEPTALYDRPVTGTEPSDQSFDESTRVRPSSDRPSDGYQSQDPGAAPYGSYGQQDAGYGAIPDGDQSYGTGYGEPDGSEGSSVPGDQGGKSKALPIAIGVAAVVIIAMIAGLAVWAFGRDSGDTVTTGTTTTSSTSTPTTPTTTATTPTTTPTTGTGTSTSLPGKLYSGTWDKKIEGTGDGVVVLPPNSKMGLIEATYSGDSNFIVQGRDTDGNMTGLYVNKIGKTEDVVAFNLGGYNDEATQISVETSGDWTVTFKKISSAPDFGSSAKGTGSKVLKWDGDSADLRAVFKPGDEILGSFKVDAVNPDDRFPDTLLSEYGDYEGTTTVQKGTTYLIVTAAGDWSLTKR